MKLRNYTKLINLIKFSLNSPFINSKFYDELTEARKEIFPFFHF